MRNTSLFYTQETPSDIMEQVSAILGFISEALGSAACSSSDYLSHDALSGLSSLCFHLRLLCQEAAER